MFCTNMCPIFIKWNWKITNSRSIVDKVVYEGLVRHLPQDEPNVESKVEGVWPYVSSGNKELRGVFERPVKF